MLLVLTGCTAPEIDPTMVSKETTTAQSGPIPIPSPQLAPPTESEKPVEEPTPTPEVSSSPSAIPEVVETAKPKPSPKPTPMPTTEPVVPVVKFKKINEVLYTTQGLNVRNGPGSSYTIIDSLNSGDEITVDAELGNWKRIEGSELWVHSGYLTSINPVEAQAASTKTLETEIKTILVNYGCPTAEVILDDARLGEVANGKANWGANQVLIRSTVPKERIVYVVAHECMHLRQYDVYGGDISQLEIDANKVYGGVNFEGLEQQADCMTQTLGIATFHYTTKCSGARGKSAKAVLAGKVA